MLHVGIRQSNKEHPMTFPRLVRHVTRIAFGTLVALFIVLGRPYSAQAVSIKEYSIPTAKSSPQRIALGPDGNLWFTEGSGNKIGRITPAGEVTEFPMPATGGSP